MKKLLLSLTTVAFSYAANAQNVNIPDANFKAYLVAHGDINTNNDTEIQVSEAQAFTGLIYCASLNITSLQGIEEFTSITGLQCFNNQLTFLDIGYNTSLMLLDCSYNQIASIYIGVNAALTNLNCANNQLTGLDVGSTSALTDLDCRNNQLTSLYLNANTTLSGLNCSGNPITSLDLSNNPALEQLFCNGNPLTSLDLSNNTALTRLHCNGSQLTSLDLSNNTVLNRLYCMSNQLTSLNLANGTNTSAVEFWCYDNPNLTCVQVDGANYSTANWSNGNVNDEDPFLFDAGVIFSENCEVTMSIEEAVTNILSIYPNPTNSIINIVATENTNITILNVLGVVVATQKLQTGNNAVDVSTLTNGIYFIQTANSGAVKFIKE